MMKCHVTYSRTTINILQNLNLNNYNNFENSVL